MSQSESVATFLDNLEKTIYGMSKAEAHQHQVCISCHQPPVIRNPAEQHEYTRLAVCGPCWDTLMAERVDDITLSGPDGLLADLPFD